jgi:SMODS-associating 2TM, beta-strand rich effector domain
MVFYAANTDFRSKVQFLLAAAAILTIYLLHTVVSKMQLTYQIDWLSNLTLPSAFALYAIFSFVFDRHLWCWPLIGQLHGIPDLNGNWEGTLKRKRFGQDEEVRAAHANITQTWSRIEMEYEGETVRSG